MKKMKKYLSVIKKTKERIYTNSINGYATIMAILCFSLLLQTLSFLSILLLQNSYISLSNKQSQIDLSCFSQARHIVENNTFIRKCNYSSEDLIQYMEMDMDDVHVTFTDHETYIEILQEQQNKKIIMKVYYDEKGIVDFDIEKK